MKVPQKVPSDLPEQIADRAADVGTLASTAGVAAYNFTNFLNDTALVVAIISGSLAISWHIYRFYVEWKEKRGNSESTEDIQSGPPE